MELEEPFKIGVLFTPSQSFLRKSWVRRFCALYGASSQGIQRLEIFENDSAFMKLSKSPSKIIPLTDCVKVTPAPQKQQANVFEVCTKTCSHQFSADSFQEMTEWLAALQTVSFGPVFSSGLAPVQFANQDVKQEENMLYSSMDEPEVYSVKSLNTEAMMRNKLHGDYKLIVTSVGISIIEDKPLNKTGKTVLSWPYRHIRRYGCSKDNFSFEAGRKCFSGEGLFAFSTLDGSVIFQSVDSHVSSLKLGQNDSDVPTSPFLEDHESSFFASNVQKVRGSSSSFAGVGDSSHHTQFKLQECSIVDGTEKAKFENEKNVTKLTHPKPPRKSKVNAYVNVQKNVDENITTSPSSQSNTSPNVYENPQNNKIETVMAQPNVFLKAGVTSTPAYEPIYAVLEAEPSSADSNLLSNSLKCLQVSDSSNAINRTETQKRVYNRKELSEDYDHLSLTKFDGARASLHAQSSDHVYGKLLCNRPSSLAESSPSAYGSVKPLKKISIAQENASTNDHCYTNVSMHNSPENYNSEREPKHILQNNAEYARVFKTKK